VWLAAAVIEVLDMLSALLVAVAILVLAGWSSVEQQVLHIARLRVWPAASMRRAAWLQ
jgi:hypothetical protein